MRHLKVAVLVALGLILGFALGCSAPDAKLIDDPLVERLEQGMEADGERTHDHAEFTELLARHVDEDAGTVDYGALKEEEERLDAYLEGLAQADVTQLGRDEQLALLLNAYNAYTVKLILENYGEIESIRDISDPWKTERYEVGGSTLSLDQIEHGIIRPLYRDPRIHFGVNCAAKDCPHLAEEAFEGSRVDEQLEARTRATLGDEKFLRLEGETIRYTKVMEWYEEDFVDDEFKGAGENLAAYIRPYGSAEVQRVIDEADGDPRMNALDYDWSLNDTGGE